MKLKKYLLSLFTIFLILFSLFFYYSSFLFISRSFTQYFGQSSGYYVNLFKHKSTLNHLNILILGLDKRDDWLEKTSTTDTIMLAQINFDSDTVNLTSLPRDLWDPALGAKINEIYPQSKTDLGFIKTNFSRIYGQDIDRVVIIKTSDLSQLVSIFGFVDVANDLAFTDNQYPNPAYISDPKNNPIYMTVSYPQGWLRLNADTIIPFIRSRKSLINGSDIGRIHRQQLVLSSLQNRLTTSQILVDAAHFSQFYSLFHQLETDLSDQDTVNLAASLYPKARSMNLNRITIDTSDNPKNALIYHPSSFSTGQWVYLASDPSYSALHHYLSQQLK